MSGIFTKNRYDNCYDVEFIEQQLNPGKWVLDKDQAENNSKCFSLNGPRANSRRGNGEIPTGDASYRHGVENFLLNLDIPNSKCIRVNSLQEKARRLNEFTKDHTFEMKECSEIQTNNHTRLDSDILANRSLYVNRFGFPIIDPSLWVYNGMNDTNQLGNERFGINTQLKAKDLYIYQ